MGKREKGAESNEALNAYRAYAAMGGIDGQKRSLAKLSELLAGPNGKPKRLGTLETWSTRFHWVERVADYDRELFEEVTEKKRKQLEADIEKMQARHIQIGMVAQERAVKQMDALITAEAFGAIAVVNLLKLGIDVERAARGVAHIKKVELTGKDDGPIQTETGMRVVFVMPEEEADPDEGETAEGGNKDT